MCGILQADLPAGLVLTLQRLRLHELHCKLVSHRRDRCGRLCHLLRGLALHRVGPTPFGHPRHCRKAGGRDGRGGCDEGVVVSEALWVGSVKGRQGGGGLGRGSLAGRVSSLDDACAHPWEFMQQVHNSILRPPSIKGVENPNDALHLFLLRREQQDHLTQFIKQL